MSLDPEKVPHGLEYLLHFAEKWDIRDDFELNAAVDNASTDELEVFVNNVDQAPDEVLESWLAGPESYDPHPSAEYIAFTVMIMAYELAKSKLKKRKNKI